MAKVRHYKAGSSHKSVAESIAQVFDDSKERAMFDEVFGGIRKPADSVLPRIPAPGSNSGLLAPKGAGGGDTFTTSLLQRLRLVEAEASETRSRLAEQLLKNEKLENQVRLLKSLTRDPQEALRDLDALRAENGSLLAQIDEMEAFLADYGLVWVGKHGAPDEAPAVEGEMGVSFAALSKAIGELNALIHAEPSKVIVSSSDDSNRRARLVHASEAVGTVRVAYYRNGLLVQRGPFRCAGSPSCAAFLQDIMEGYFPSELSGDYPDGVLFDLVDKQDLSYGEQSQEDEQMSADKFLRGLPRRQITKAGDIVDLRADIGLKLGIGGGAAVAKVIDSDASRADADAAHSRGSVATIQVKWMDGSSFLAKAFALSSVREVKADILRHLSSSAGVGGTKGVLELRGGHPVRTLADGMTVLEAGLLPNGTVHARYV